MIITFAIFASLSLPLSLILLLHTRRARIQCGFIPVAHPPLHSHLHEQRSRKKPLSSLRAYVFTSSLFLYVCSKLRACACLLLSPFCSLSLCLPAPQVVADRIQEKRFEVARRSEPDECLERCGQRKEALDTFTSPSSSPRSLPFEGRKRSDAAALPHRVVPQLLRAAPRARTSAHGYAQTPLRSARNAGKGERERGRISVYPDVSTFLSCSLSVFHEKKRGGGRRRLRSERVSRRDNREKKKMSFSGAQASGRSPWSSLGALS